MFHFLKRCSAGQPCDITGIEDYAALDRAGGIQWPCPASDSDFAQERRLFEGGRFYHPDGQARFLFDEPTPIPERPNSKFPFLLLTGRGSASQWHTQTRTRQSAVLRKLYPQHLFVEIDPHDAGALAIRPHEEILVESQRGHLRAKAVLTHAVGPGQVFIPMHYEAVNRLTLGIFDPHSHQPAYKACAVRLSRESGL